MNRIIGLDIDGVCADLITPWLFRYNIRYNDDLTIDDITDWNIHNFVKPECGTKIYDYIEDPTLYDLVLPIKNSLFGVSALRDMGYRVVFVTSSTLGASGRKFRWLQDYGFTKDLKDYVEMSDKSLFAGDYLVDDYIVNINGFNGDGVLFTQNYNKRFTHTPRVNDWNEVIRFFSGEQQYD